MGVPFLSGYVDVEIHAYVDDMQSLRMIKQSILSLCLDAGE